MPTPRSLNALVAVVSLLTLTAAGCRGYGDDLQRSPPAADLAGQPAPQAVPCEMHEDCMVFNASWQCALDHCIQVSQPVGGFCLNNWQCASGCCAAADYVCVDATLCNPAPMPDLAEGPKDGGVDDGPPPSIDIANMVDAGTGDLANNPAADLASPPDQAQRPDLAPTPDLAVAPDLVVNSDLAPALDLAPAPDLVIARDLIPASDMALTLRERCNNGQWDGDETAPDCGGACANPPIWNKCWLGAICRVDNDCWNEVDKQFGRCTAGTCTK